MRRFLVFLLLGFSSGLPLALTGATLQAWFTVSGTSIVTIGLLTLVGLPYTYKFLWAPIFDRFIPPFLGRRRGWLLITQMALFIAIAAMAFGNPIKQPFVLSILALIIAFLSASQDINVDAYRTEITPANQRGLSSALYSGGYRLALMISGGLGLILADHIGWHATYLIMAAFMIVGITATFIGYEADQAILDIQRPTSFSAAVIEPFREFFSRPFAWGFLLLAVLYKFGDALSLSLSTPFLIRGLGFSLTAIGAINKVFGLVAAILGVFLGGAIMLRISLYRALLWFGILQLVAILMLLLLALIGKNYTFLIITVFTDYLFNGMGTTALLALLMSLCDKRYTATQYALLSAITAIGRVFVGPLAGLLVKYFGWANFFIIALVISLPSLFLLKWMKGKINEF